MAFYTLLKPIMLNRALHNMLHTYNQKVHVGAIGQQLWGSPWLIYSILGRQNDCWGCCFFFFFFTDLYIDDRGNLVDTKSGKVINDFGATRFDVAVRALRGELDPPKWVEVRCRPAPQYDAAQRFGLLVEHAICNICNACIVTCGLPCPGCTMLYQSDATLARLCIEKVACMKTMQMPRGETGASEEVSTTSTVPYLPV